MQANKALLLSAMLSSSESVENAEIATFDATCVCTPDISVDLEPIQDLHGYDNPWPAGGGKNLYNSETFHSTTINDVTCTNNGDGSFTLNGTASADTFFNIFNRQFNDNPLPSAEYRLTGCPSEAGSSAFYFYTTPAYGGDRGNGQTFTNMITGGSIYIKSETTVNNVTIWPMLRLASNGDDTFAPYSNLCPISGRSEVNVFLEEFYDHQATPKATIQLGQTVYAGQIDVTEGVLKVTKAYATLNDSTKWKTSASSSVDFEYDMSFSNAKNTGNSYDGLICSYVPVRFGSEPYGRWIGATQHKFGIKWVSGTLTDIQADATAGRIAICYELATPIEVTLTPKQIQTLVGENNVWSDSGNISVRNITCDADFLRLFLMTKLIGDY